MKVIVDNMEDVDYRTAGFFEIKGVKLPAGMPEDTYIDYLILIPNFSDLDVYQKFLDLQNIAYLSDDSHSDPSFLMENLNGIGRII